MKLKKCSECKEYTFKENCKNCDKKYKTKSPHYKYLRLKDAPKSDIKKVRKN